MRTFFQDLFFSREPQLFDRGIVVTNGVVQSPQSEPTQGWWIRHHPYYSLAGFYDVRHFKSVPAAVASAQNIFSSHVESKNHFRFTRGPDFESEKNQQACASNANYHDCSYPDYLQNGDDHNNRDARHDGKNPLR
jgi:hypothetical protein